MRHLTISQFGSYLGVSGNRLVVSTKEGETWETPLSRLRTIRIEKQGVSISSALILACAIRGIRLFFVDWRNIGIAAVCGLNQHAVVAVRQAQFECIKSFQSVCISTKIIVTKLKNQRVVLLYFSKYLSKIDEKLANILQIAADSITSICNSIKVHNWQLEFTKNVWREKLLGYEGKAASIYWESLISSKLLPESFEKREGRGSIEIVNSALNYGYTILTSYIWSALDNAGLELYAGLLHTRRSGKPSLVLDFMEEYRAWVVDRNIIKMRFKLANAKFLDSELKKEIVNSIDKTMSSLFNWSKTKLKLENVIQRQAYRLVGSIVEEKKYKGFVFKW